MNCPHCNLPMQRHTASNGQVFWKCPICKYEEEVGEDVPSYNDIEAYKEVKGSED